MDGQGVLQTILSPEPRGTGFASSSRTSILNPGSGNVAEPGFNGVMGRGDTRNVPVSVCHQVSIIGSLPAPKVFLYHIQASGLMGSPTDPSSLRLETSYFLAQVSPAFINILTAVGAV